MIGLLPNVVAKERDPAVADKVTTMGRKRRLPVQLYSVIVLTCRRRASLAVRRVPSSGFEAWKQLCREFEPWVFVATPVDAPGPIAANEDRQSGAGQFNRLSGDRTSENVRPGSVAKVVVRDEEFAHQPDLQSGRSMTMCNLACDETAELVKAGQTRAVSGVVERADLSPRGKGGGGKKSQDKSKGVKTAKPKECFCCVTSSHSKSEYKNLSAAVEQKFVQRVRTSRHANVEVDSESDERRCSRWSGMASPAHGLDVVLLPWR